MTTYYMACLDLEGRRVVVVGAGRIALEKIQGVLACGASVEVVAPEIEPDIEGLEAGGSLRVHRRTFAPTDVDGAFLVIAATNDMRVNTNVYEAAEARSVPVNVVDVPSLCSFILPAVERNGPLAIAISTAGASPALAKRIKREVSNKVGDAYVKLAELLQNERAWAKEHLPTYDDRKVFFEAIVNARPDPIDLLERDEIDEVLALIERTKRQHLLPRMVAGLA